MPDQTFYGRARAACDALRDYVHGIGTEQQLIVAARDAKFAQMAARQAVAWEAHERWYQSPHQEFIIKTHFWTNQVTPGLRIWRQPDVS